MDKPQGLIATHEGMLSLGNQQLKCLVLNDGTRIISRNAVFKAFGRTKRGRAKDESRVPNMPSFIDANNLQPFIDNELSSELIPIEYSEISGREGTGYKAEVLPMLCNVYLEARRQDKLTKSQLPLAIASEILLQGLSKVGIIALIDEVTGFQFEKDRAKDTLQRFLQKFLRDDAAKWVKTFEDDFFEMIFIMRNWHWNDLNKRPGVVGRYINDIVYSRIAPGVLNELRSRNPIVDGKRRKKHHQFLSTDFGHPKLKEHLSGVMALGRASGYNWRVFIRLLDKSYPKYGETIKINFPETLEEIESQVGINLSGFNKSLKQALDYKPKE